MTQKIAACIWYGPGMCASGADRDVPLANLPWAAGTPEPLVGGTVPDARWLFTGGRYVVDSASTAIGEIDLTQPTSTRRSTSVLRACPRNISAPPCCSCRSRAASRV